MLVNLHLKYLDLWLTLVQSYLFNVEKYKISHGTILFRWTIYIDEIIFNDRESYQSLQYQLYPTLPLLQ